MNRLSGAVAAIVAGLGGPAVADDGLSATAEPTMERAPGKSEVSVFLGGFISNHFHQFYDLDVMPDREALERFSPLFGARFAYFFSPILGVEVESSVILATTDVSKEGAQIYGLTGRLLLQKPGRITPFVGLGAGLTYVSSDDDVLGSDADFPIHIGGGVRVFATRALAVRVDGRFIRGPSQQDPYTLNASYGEFTIGLAFNPATLARRGEPR